MLTRKRLKEVLQYSPETGVWKWLVRGLKLAGNINKVSGRRTIMVDGHSYLASRLAWLYMKGYWSKRQVDHKDTDNQNDRWKNLRLATNGQNRANSRASKNNKFGFKGVHWEPNKRKWKAQATFKKENYFLGYFNQPQLGAQAYKKFAREHHKEFAR